VVGVAYYGGKANWFQPRIAAPVPPRSARPKVPPASAAKQADLQFKALLADILAGNWPDGYKTSKQKSIFFEMLIANGANQSPRFPDLVAWLHDQPDSRDRQMMMFTLLGYLAGRGDAKFVSCESQAGLANDRIPDGSHRAPGIDGRCSLTIMAGDDPQKALAELQNFRPAPFPWISYTGIFGGLRRKTQLGRRRSRASLAAGLRARTTPCRASPRSGCAPIPLRPINWASSLPPENSAVSMA